MQPDELYDWVPDKGVRAPNHKDIQLWRDEKGRTMFEYDRVDRLELEFNNTCFLYCGGCGRTYNPKIEAAGKHVEARLKLQYSTIPNQSTPNESNKRLHATRNTHILDQTFRAALGASGALRKLVQNVITCTRP